MREHRSVDGSVEQRERERGRESETKDNMAQKRISDFFNRPTKNAKSSRTESEGADAADAAPSSSLPTITDDDHQAVRTCTTADSVGACESAANTQEEPQPHVPPNVLGFDEPCRPDIRFPGRKIGTETFERSFQKSWFTKWKWLHYVTERDTVLCFSCCKAMEKGLRHHNRKTSSFIVGGFCNWRKATTKFASTSCLTYIQNR